MNYFMIGGDKKEYGPVTTEQLRQWLSEGRANGDTLLRLENETLWKPLRSFPDFQDSPGNAASAEPDSLPFGSQSAVVPMDGAPRELPVQIGHAFARAWHLVGAHFGVIAPATFMVWIAMTALLFAPCFGVLAMLFYGPMIGSLFLLFLKLIREGEASPADIFTLSRDNVMPLMLTGLVGIILTELATACCCVLPGVYLHIAWLFGIPLVADRGLTFWQGLETSRRVITRQWFKFLGLFLVSFLPAVVFHFYMTAREWSDIAPFVQQMIAVIQAAMGSGAVNEPELKRIAEEISAIQRGYISWALMKQALLLISMPLGIGSLAFVYEDIFGRKRQAD